ncbi:uncharacterized protein PHACADRAFT_213681 [Phanerochaete carnosa HHB-10118-sp]|uniref:Uncharacterized protein n=1 Tax=Phanerochaete carnosa (strain HHB-10118-sp) TaxID=650164 RepID=K5VW67_PHACS|nr:uncharacterized protein PHACADRAFT_213681 [Phanerochaete carnosa HHB-10118-sp]EKM50819.1 hypothetical protein PHACADRAFT_213681 [Phanerochaete carnosa HHB-10118-sp]
MSQNTTVVRVDDRDPTVFYSGNWSLAGNNETEFDGTTHGALTNGSTIEFTFNGTSVTFYGTVPGAPTGSPSTSSFMVDNGEKVLVMTPQPADPMYQYAYFASGPLEDGMHTLVVTAVNTDQEDMLWFDYLEYALISAADTGAGGGGLSSPAPSLSGSSTPSLSSPTSPTNLALSGTTHKASNLRTILPAVIVPAAALLLLLGVLFFLWRRRQQSRRYDSWRVNILGEDLSDVPPEAKIISPYTTVRAPAPALTIMSAPPSISMPSPTSTSMLTPTSLNRSLPSPSAPWESRESIVLSIPPWDSKESVSLPMSQYSTDAVRRSDAALADPPAYTALL